MKIVESRIDNRLIHGQVATRWIQHTDAKVILVVDDDVAGNDFEKNLLKMACPKNVQLIVRNCEKAVALVNKDESDFETMIIVKYAKAARRLTELGLKVDHWTVGNIPGLSSNEERHQILKFFMPTKSEAEDLKYISEGLRCVFLCFVKVE